MMLRPAREALRIFTPLIREGMYSDAMDAYCNELEEIITAHRDEISELKRELSTVTKEYAEYRRRK